MWGCIIIAIPRILRYFELVNNRKGSRVELKQSKNSSNEREIQCYEELNSRNEVKSSLTEIKFDLNCLK